MQPWLGEGPLEDARPPRFANQVGAAFTWAGAAAGALGLPLLSAVLGGAVAALALLSATTGFCTGCALYRLGAHLRGLHPGTPLHVDLGELGVEAGRGAVVQFTHPLCSGCHESQLLAGDMKPYAAFDHDQNGKLDLLPFQEVHVQVRQQAFHHPRINGPAQDATQDADFVAEMRLADHREIDRVQAGRAHGGGRRYSGAGRA